MTSVATIQRLQEAGAKVIEADDPCALAKAIKKHGLPWHVARVGARVEFICAPGPLRNGSEAEAAHAPALERAVHLPLVNRGVLIAPFHNMMLISPATRPAQVARLVAAFSDVTASLAPSSMSN